MDPQQLQIVLGQLAHAFGMPPPPPLTPDQIASGSSLMSQLLATLGLAGNAGDPTDMAAAEAGHAKRGEKTGDAMSQFPAADQDGSKQLEQLMSSATQMPQQFMQAFGGLFQGFSQGVNQAMQQGMQMGTQMASSLGKAGQGAGLAGALPADALGDAFGAGGAALGAGGAAGGAAPGWRMPPSRPETSGRHRFRQLAPIRPRRNRFRCHPVHPTQPRERGGRWAACR